MVRPLAIACLLLAACTTTGSVLEIGRDTFTVSGRSEWGSGKARSAAINAANRYAAERGMRMKVVTMQPGWDRDALGDRWYTMDLTFRVIPQDDPEYQTRPNLIPSQRTVITHENAPPAAPPQAAQSTPKPGGDVDAYLRGLLERGEITPEQYGRLVAERLGVTGDDGE